jgi:hypothetical protein
MPPHSINSVIPVVCLVLDEPLISITKWYTVMQEPSSFTSGDGIAGSTYGTYMQRQSSYQAASTGNTQSQHQFLS